ncbi:hypothetical protein CEXT_53451 [Caerostris extrusa]|uniref:Uncharacterized protein n=1 Tax=Caerostris extrusa TaxID=172846 RepID=A0AAV4UR93_CAEEX|nr:hypothetical protein CEXT_53451 [Caerostris extrusa]
MPGSQGPLALIRNALCGDVLIGSLLVHCSLTRRGTSAKDHRLPRVGPAIRKFSLLPKKATRAEGCYSSGRFVASSAF